MNRLTVQQDQLLSDLFKRGQICDINSRDLSFFFFFLIRGGTRSLRMPVLRPASQVGPMRNPMEGTSVVLRDTIRLT